MESWVTIGSQKHHFLKLVKFRQAKFQFSQVFKYPNQTKSSSFLRYTCQKIYQAEKVRPNKQMSPKRIEIIIGDPSPSYKCRLQEQIILGRPLPFHQHLNIRWDFIDYKALPKISILIDFMSNTSDILLRFQELPSIHS